MQHCCALLREATQAKQRCEVRENRKMLCLYFLPFAATSTELFIHEGEGSLNSECIGEFPRD